MKDRHGPATVRLSEFEEVTGKLGRQEERGGQVRRTACLESPFDLRAMGRVIRSDRLRVHSFTIQKEWLFYSFDLKSWLYKHSIWVLCNIGWVMLPGIAGLILNQGPPDPGSSSS